MRPETLQATLVLLGLPQHIAKPLAAEVVRRKGEYKWLAQDSTGHWYLYNDKPKPPSKASNYKLWRTTEGYYAKIIHTSVISAWGRLLIDLSFIDN